MKMRKHKKGEIMRIAITGATGLLGRNLLFEIIKNNLSTLSELEILIFCRPKDNRSHIQRINDIVLNDGMEYIGCKNDSYMEIFKSLKPISFDLQSDDLQISKQDYSFLKSFMIDKFFHVAAHTDFRSGAETEKKLMEINVKGTQRICALARDIKAKELIYIGSAYSCGNKTGLISPSYIHNNDTYRNPYEKTKHEAEIFLREFAKTNKLKFKVFRPSTICGRLIEPPIGRTHKYDVFYSWVAFFIRQKIKMLNSTEKIFEMPINMPIRLQFNPKGGLNIVPVDYCSKAIYDICIRNNEDNTDYHLASPKITPNEVYGDATFKLLNISGYQYVLNEPEDKNSIEGLYYKTVGKLFTPYGISDPIIFDVNNLKAFERRTGIKCPIVDRNAFSALLNYAKEDFFGIPIEKLSKIL